MRDNPTIPDPAPAVPGEDEDAYVPWYGGGWERDDSGEWREVGVDAAPALGTRPGTDDTAEEGR